MEFLPIWRDVGQVLLGIYIVGLPLNFILFFGANRQLALYYGDSTSLWDIFLLVIKSTFWWITWLWIFGADIIPNKRWNYFYHLDGVFFGVPESLEWRARTYPR